MKKKCTICGKKTEDWEIVNGGSARCWECGKEIREADEVANTQKLLQDAEWHVTDFCRSLVTYDKTLSTIARVNFGIVEKAVARQFYCDDVEIEFLNGPPKPFLMLHLQFMPDENDDLDTVDTMNVDTDELMTFFYLRTYIKEQKLKVKINPQIQKRWRKVFTDAVDSLKKVQKSKTFKI